MVLSCRGACLILSLLACTRGTPVLLRRMAAPSLALVDYWITMSVAPFLVRVGHRV